MRWRILVFASAFTIATFTAGHGAHGQTYLLPQDPAAPVITLDYRGDRLKRIDEAPTLSILASGSVIMPQSYAHTRAYEGQISEAELQGLLDFIIRENRFFDYNSEAVDAKLSRLWRQPLPAHLSTTVISVNADNQTKEIRCHALGHGPQVEETERLLAIKHRLNRLMSTVKLGGSAEVAKWVEIANQNLGLKSLKSLDAAPLTAEDLEGVGQAGDGSSYIRFVRRDVAKTTMVTIDVTADGENHVTVAQGDL